MSLRSRDRAETLLLARGETLKTWLSSRRYSRAEHVVTIAEPWWSIIFPATTVSVEDTTELVEPDTRAQSQSTDSTPARS